jgi:hypothetical protein
VVSLLLPEREFGDGVAAVLRHIEQAL